MATNSIESVHKGGMNFTTLINGHSIVVDLAKTAGGNDEGTSPKILMLVSLAGCTGVDVVSILNKGRVKFSDFTIHIDAHLTEEHPKIYDDVTITYNIKVNKSLLNEFSPKTVTLFEMTGGFLALCIIIPFYLRFFPATYYIPTFSDWMWLLILSWVCTVLAFILSLNALKRISPFTANLTFNLEPVYSIILAFIFFHENKFLGPGFYFGLSLILLAIILQMKRVWNERKLNMR